jgi:hypothetical protein
MLNTTTCCDASGNALRTLNLHALGFLATASNGLVRRLSGQSRRRVFGLRNAAYAALSLARVDRISPENADLLLPLSRFAREANRVAHALPEADQGPVFALKGVALSALILGRAAVVNDVTVDGTVGLDLLIEPGARLHCPLALLAPPARTLAKRQAAFVPVSAPLSESVNPAQLEGLLRLVGRAA